MTLFKRACLFIDLWCSFNVISIVAGLGSSYTSDALALLQLKDGLNDSQGNLRTWDFSSSPCGWFGVTCDSEFAQVVSVNLSGQNLSGTIGNSVGNLLFLKELNLSDNDLTGIIPPDLGQLRFLSYLDLSNNHLNGSIPRELGWLLNLMNLTLSNNNLEGEIPWELGKLQMLTTLYLDMNNFQGPFPASLGNCSLIYTDFSYNHLTGGIPHEFGNLLQLEYFIANHNELDGEISPQLGNCSALVYVGLGGNRLTGDIPSSLGFNVSSGLLAIDFYDNRLTGGIPHELCNCEALYQLQLQNNVLTGSLPPCLGSLPLQYLRLDGNQLTGNLPRNFSTLVKVNLSDNNLTGIIPPEFGEISSLSELILYGNAFGGPIPEKLGSNGSLTILDIGSNLFSGSIPATICETGLLKKIVVQFNQMSGTIPSDIGKCEQLRRLLLGGNRFEGSIPSGIGSLAVSLFYVDISNNQLNGSLPPEIGYCKNLSALLLSHNMIQGPLPSTIGQLGRLEEFNISNNKLTGPIHPELGGCSLLFKLDLSNNQLSGSIPPQLGGLTQLEILRLQGNMFSGFIPSEISAFHSIQALDLGKNQFHGQIPGKLLAKLVSLQTILNLSHNQFMGAIPHELGQLVGLEIMDLSYNRLQGQIPRTLGDMVSLLYLNLSYNNLSGPILHTSTFDGISADSYIGNPGLVCVFNGTRPAWLTNKCTVDGYPIFAPEDTSHSKPGTQKQTFGMSPINAALLTSGVATGLLIFLAAAGVGWRHRRILNERERCEKEREEAESPFGMSPDEFTTKEIISATRNLKEENVIGRGGFGTVYKITLETGEVLAVKKVQIQQEVEGIPNFQSYVREIRTAGRIRHRNIVRLYGYCKQQGVVLIIYDYIPNGSLGDLLHRSSEPMDCETRYKIALGTAYGISYLHWDCVPQIIHRDIKSNNILLDDEMEPHLTDFGVAKLVLESSKESMSLIAGSVGYIAPEYCYTLRVTEKSDVYSFGVVVLELLTRTSATSKDFPEGMDFVHWVRRDFGPIMSVALDAEHPTYFDTIRSALDADLLQSATDSSSTKIVISGLFHVALLCTSEDPVERPTMQEVIQLLLRLGNEYKKVKLPKLRL